MAPLTYSERDVRFAVCSAVTTASAAGRLNKRKRSESLDSLECVEQPEAVDSGRSEAELSVGAARVKSIIDAVQTGKRSRCEQHARAVRAIVATMRALNDPTAKGRDRGVWYGHRYQECHPADWRPEFAGGRAGSAFEQQGAMQWTLRPGQSASEGLKSWLSGLTIAECATSLVVAHLNGIREFVGDDQFDTWFGSASHAEPAIQRLRVTSDHLDCMPEAFLKGAGRAVDGELNRVVGAKYYFKNDERYLLRHPAGVAQGENAIFIGHDSNKQPLWSGFGVEKVNTQQMAEGLKRAFDVPRTEADYQAIVEHPTTHVDADWLRDVSQHFSYRAIYEKLVAGERVHPEFVAAEEVDQTKPLRPATVEGQGVMLNWDEIARRVQTPGSSSGCCDGV